MTPRVTLVRMAGGLQATCIDWPAPPNERALGDFPNGYGPATLLEDLGRDALAEPQGRSWDEVAAARERAEQASIAHLYASDPWSSLEDDAVPRGTFHDENEGGAMDIGSPWIISGVVFLVVLGLFLLYVVTNGGRVGGAP